MSDYGTLKLPVEELDQLRSDAQNARYVSTDNAKLMEQYLHQHSDSTRIEEEQKPTSTTKSESKRLGHEGWQSYFHGFFDRLHGGHHHHHTHSHPHHHHHHHHTHEHTHGEKIEAETMDRRKCDTIDAARRFYQEKFADGLEVNSNF